MRPAVLVLRALGLGDLLTGLPALRGLRATFPRHELLLAAPPDLAPLALWSEAVDRVLPSEGLTPLPPCRPEVAVNLHGRGPESHNALLASGAGGYLWFENDEVPVSEGAPRWRAGEHEVDRWCRMLREQGVPADPGRLDLRLPPPGRAAELAGATLIHPGASTPARRWPVERWAEVAGAERERGRTVVVTGGAAEVDLAGEVARLAQLPDACVFAGSLGVLGLAALVGVAGLLLCSDTGVAHLATALRTPSVVLFGPTSPALWGPPPQRPWNRALWAGVPGPADGPVAHPGLLAITVEEALQAVADLPAAPARPS